MSSWWKRFSPSATWANSSAVNSEAAASGARATTSSACVPIDPVEPSTCNKAPCQASSPARVKTNEGMAKRSICKFAWLKRAAS